MASYLQQMRELEELKKKAEANNIKLSTNKGVSLGTPSSMPKVGPIESLPKVTVSQRAGLAAEKASRYYLQNSPDMYNSTPKQIGPKQWAGPTNTAALRVAPGSSNVKKAAAANNRANAAYLKYAAEAYVPESLPKVGDTPIGPQQLPSVGNLTPYTPNTKPVKELSFKEKFMQKGLNPSETWANSSMELPAVPTAAKQGGGLGNRGYNAVSSIGDNMIGADKSLKATANQSFENEKAYRNALMSYNETIDAIMLARDRYPSTSDEYKKYSLALDKIYAAADSLRDKAADMTDANQFMTSAEQLRREATKGLSGLPLQFAETAISVGDNLATMGMTGFNPTATLIMMGAKAAGQRANELSNQGVSAGDAFSRGVLSGVIEGLTERVGIDNLFKIVKSKNAVGIIKNMLKQAAAEGGEEGLSNILNYAADRMSGENKPFDWDDFAQQTVQGVLSGLMFGFGGTIVNKVMPMVSGYSDMEHLNMAQELEAKRAKKPLESMVMPSVGKYSSNTANTGVNIENMSAEEYLDKYNNELVRKSEQSEYMKQVYDVMMGKMPSHKAVEVMKTPDILKQYGAKDLTITIDQKNIRKIAYPQDYLGLEQGHNLGFYFIEQLPVQLSKPVAILKSKTQKNSFVIVTEMVDTFNKPVLVAVHLDKNGKIGLSNEIASAYGKDNYNSFISDNRKKGNIVYEDINRGLDSLPVNGLQLSEMEATTDPIFSIYKNSDTVNTQTDFNKKSNGNNIESSATGFQTGSIGANNNPLLNNTVPNSEQKSNSIGNNNLGIINPDNLPYIEPTGNKTFNQVSVESLNKSLGVDASIIDEADMPSIIGKNGMYKDGKIYINKNSSRPQFEVFKHELTHYIESSPKYNGLLDDVTGYLDSMFKDNSYGDMTVDTAIRGVMDDYADQGISLSYEDARHEVVADFVGEYLFKNEAELYKLVNRKPVIIQRILDIINDLIGKFKGHNTSDIVKMQRKFRDALYSSNGYSNGAKFDIMRDSTGKPKGVLIKENILDGHEGEKAYKVIEDYLTNHIGEYATIIESGQKVYLGKDLPGEYTHSKSTQKMANKKRYAELNAKNQAAQNLNEIIETATGRQWEKNFKTKHNIDAKYGFYKYNTEISVMNKGKYETYTGEIIIRNDADGKKYLYDIVGIKRKSNRSQLASTSMRSAMGPAKAGEAHTAFSNKTIPQPKDTVNYSDITNIDSYINPALRDDYKNASETNDGKNSIGTESFDQRMRRYARIYANGNDLNLTEIATLTEADADTRVTLKGKNNQAKGNSESKFAESIKNQKIYNENFKSSASGNSNINTYDSITNENTMKEANNKLNAGGAAETMRWNSINPKTATAQDIAEGFILMERFQDIGDYDSMIAVAEKLRQMGTGAGQTVQAFSIMKRMTPEGMVEYAQNSLQNALEEMKKIKTQKWIDNNSAKFNLTPEDAKFITEHMQQAAKLPDGREKIVLLAEIQARIQDKIPPVPGQKARTLARISMLFNPKTQLRNILGNVTVMPQAVAADLAGNIIDKAVSSKTGIRTTGGFKPSAIAEIPKGIKEAWLDYKKGINTREVSGNKFEIGQGKSFSDSNPLGKMFNFIDGLNSFMLDAGDRGFYRMWYENSLKNQMRKNGVTEISQEMKDIAVMDALERTWQDDNGYTKSMTAIKRVLNKMNIKGYGLGDMIMPFVKTPSNLVKAVVDYSPIGFVNALVKDSQNLKKAVASGQNVAQAQRAYVNDLSKGIVGSLLLALWAILADKGILTGDRKDDKDVNNFEKYIMGLQPYSVNVDGKTYSYEWAQPVGGSMAMMADFVNTYKRSSAMGNGEIKNAVNAILDGAKAAGNTLFNLTVTYGLAQFFDGGDVVSGAVDTALGEPSKFMPSLLGQFAQFGDDTMRRTYENGDYAQTVLNQIKAKTPGARETLEPVIDVLGREVRSNNSVFDTFFNPANYYKDNSDKVADEIYELYGSTGDKSVIPPTAPYSIKYKGEDISLTAEDISNYQRTTGSIIHDCIEDLILNSAYGNLSDEDKAEVYKDIYSYAIDVAKDKLIPNYELSGTSKEAQKAANSGLSEADYYLYKYYFNLEDAKGNKLSNEEKRSQLESNPYLSANEKNLLDDLLIDDGFYMPKEKSVDYSNHENFILTQMSDSAQKSYKLVESVIPVDMYADLSSRLNKLDYPKGQRSPYYKKAIDMYLEAYEYNPTRNERFKIYESLGVAKKYWY